MKWAGERERGRKRRHDECEVVSSAMSNGHARAPARAASKQCVESLVAVFTLRGKKERTCDASYTLFLVFLGCREKGWFPDYGDFGKESWYGLADC